MRKCDIPKHFKKVGDCYYFEHVYFINYDGCYFYLHDFYMDFHEDEMYIGGDNFGLYLKLDKIEEFSKFGTIMRCS